MQGRAYQFGARCFAALLMCAVTVGCSAPVAAQDKIGFGEDLFPEFSLSPGISNNQQPASWSARYLEIDDRDVVRVEVTADLSNSWHIYSLTQKAGGPKPTRLSIVEPESAELVGKWSPNKPPKSSVSEDFGGLTVEEHEGRITFSAQVRLSDGFDGPISVRVDALVCQASGACIPVKETLAAKRVERPATSAETATAADDSDAASGTASTDEATVATKPVTSEPFRDGSYVVEWLASYRPGVAKPGDRVQLRFTADPDSGYHVYTAAVDDSSSSTNFVVSEKDELQVGAPQTASPIIVSDVLPDTAYHKGTVTWVLPVQVPEDASAGEHTLEGSIVYQACTETSCQRPMALNFTAVIPVTGDTSGTNANGSITLTAGKRAEALDLAATSDWVDTMDAPPQKTLAEGQLDADDDQGREEDAPLAVADAGPSPQPPGDDDELGPATAAEIADEASTSFPFILLLAFGGGLILNVMPCVLPVVGLKVMGFVKQAGEDRRRILVLNLAYIAGILSVFALLAILAITLSFGWGQQLTYFPVRLGLTLALFALALSYFGVWEIPAPGFAAGKASQELQQREGLGGAYSKGVFATILATPCSGPLLGYILGLTLALSSAQTFFVFMVVGAGMSLPYLLVGLSPRLIAWLPKPGPWMETLKQFLAFLFLGTVAFFFATFQDEHKVPVFVALMGVWFGCWLIGQVPSWERMNKRLAAWVAGIAAATAIGVAAFQFIGSEAKLQWEPYSEARLQQLQKQGRTVLLDFGAKWCGNCIYNYETAINTEPTREKLADLDAVAMYADWTDPDPEIESKLQELNSISIPLLAIYPGSNPDEPIILRDIVTQTQILNALQAAGPSIGVDTSSIATTEQQPPLATVAR